MYSVPDHLLPVLGEAPVSGPGIDAKPEAERLDVRTDVESCLRSAPRTFEGDVLPKDLRHAVAAHNRTVDERRYPVKFGLRQEDAPVYPHSAVVPVLNLFLPGGCNAVCPKYCFTSARTEQESDLALPQVQWLLDEFHEFGTDSYNRSVRPYSQMVRILGRGEPFLQPDLLPILRHARKLDMTTIIFTNGSIRPSKEFLRIYRGSPHIKVYVKLWSEDPEKQNEMVRPDRAYEYCDGIYGPAPRAFYDLFLAGEDETAPFEQDEHLAPWHNHIYGPPSCRERVGFETMVSRENVDEVAGMVRGQKKYAHWFLEPMQQFGYGSRHGNLSVTAAECRERGIPITLECNNPPRALYMMTVNAKRQMCPEVFVQDDAIDLRRGNLREAWETAIERPAFFQARYQSAGCFCQEYSTGKGLGT